MFGRGSKRKSGRPHRTLVPQRVFIIRGPVFLIRGKGFIFVGAATKKAFGRNCHFSFWEDWEDTKQTLSGTCSPLYSQEFTGWMLAAQVHSLSGWHGVALGDWPARQSQLILFLALLIILLATRA